jgi:HSP20 family protein
MPLDFLVYGMQVQFGTISPQKGDDAMADVGVTKSAAQDKPAKPSTALGRRFSTMLAPFGGGLFNMNPFALMREFADEFDRGFSGLLEPESAGAWMPRIECKRKDKDFVVSAELPGLRKEDVHVEITDDALIVRGERSREDVEQREGFYRSERAYGRFYRSIPLPEGAQTDKSKAELKDGVLTVTIPAAEAPKESRREIPVQDQK